MPPVPLSHPTNWACASQEQLGEVQALRYPQRQGCWPCRQLKGLRASRCSTSTTTGAGSLQLPQRRRQRKAAPVGERAAAAMPAVLARGRAGLGRRRRQQQQPARQLRCVTA